MIPSNTRPICQIVDVLVIYFKDASSRYYQHFSSITSTPLIAVLDVLVTTYHSRRELLKELNNYDLENLIQDRRWDSDDFW